MADLETKTTEKVNSGIDDQGAVVREESRSVETKTDPKTTAINVVWYVYGFVASLLGLRMIMKLFGANSSSGFVDLIYSVSGILSAPFDNIFGVTKGEAGTTEAVFEPSILVAIAVYALIAWGIAKLLTINENQ